MKKLFIGTSGYNYKHWKDVFYPKEISQKNWLSFYANRFNSVEINASFYRSFERKVFEKWHNITPSNFLFTIKGPRFITHIKRITNVSSEISLFFDNAKGLKEKLSVVLWQFPESFKCTEETKVKLENFLKLLPKNIKNAFEFRNESWFTNEIYKLLNKNCAGFVINDTSTFPTKEVVSGNFVYIRFHGPKILYSSSYSKNELKVWAKKIKKYLKKYDVYCYFNNDAFGHAVQNAKELKNYFSS